MSENNSSIELPSLESVDSWEQPILFDDTETPEIPAKLLPEIFSEFAAALAQATETAEAMSVMTILGVLSTALAKQFKISPKENWYEPINIYTLIALPPANHKTLVLNACTKPLLEWEKHQLETEGAAVKRQRSERKSQEKIIETLRIKTAKMDDSLEQRQLIQDIAEKETNLIDAPALPLLFANDVTPESLATLVHEQHGRLAIFSDEGGILETLAGLYNQGNANIDIILKGIDGGEVRIHRKDKCIALNPYLTIVLTVQPAIIQSMGKKRAYLGNGTLERFLYVIPKSKLGFRTHDKPPLSTQLQLEYDAKIFGLLNQFYLTQSNRFKQATILKLSDAAYAAWHDLQTHIEIQLRSNGKLANCLGWGGKICGFTLRIAGLLHIAEHGIQDLIINESTMMNALEIAHRLTEHAIAAFGLMGVDQTTEDAKELFQWLKTREQSSFTQSEIVLAMRNRKLGKAERLQRALQLLKDRHLISPPIKLPTRKPTTVYYIHPDILQDQKKRNL